MAIDARPARRPDVPALARVLARAFFDDPVFVGLSPNASRRRSALPGFFAALARHHFLAGPGAEVATTDSGIGAVALWEPPGVA